MTAAIEQNSLHSVLRERIVEHLLTGELLRRLWSFGITSVEILRSEFDRGGYDLVADNGPVVRHVQLKCSVLGGSASHQKISRNLALKPSGCVIWVVVDHDLNFDHFLWFGAGPGEKLPSVDDLKVARHAKGNSLGVKGLRQNLREVKKSKFQRVEDFDSLLTLLFGADWQISHATESVSDAAR